MGEYTLFLDEIGQFPVTPPAQLDVRPVGRILVKGALHAVRPMLDEDISRVFAGTPQTIQVWRCAQRRSIRPYSC